jgi:hypothetical protein
MWMQHDLQEYRLAGAYKIRWQLQAIISVTFRVANTKCWYKAQFARQKFT